MAVGPHQGQPILRAGRPVSEARAAMVLAHGRGGSAQDMLDLAAELQWVEFAYLAPQAKDNTWYPFSFLAPLERNEPALSSALALLEEVTGAVEAEGLGTSRTIFLGFSQGACLVAEFAARRARRYGAVVSLSGGVIGPPGLPRSYTGSLDGTPVFLGCSDVDPHVPRWRVEETAAVFRQMGGEVTERIYPGMGHTVNADELNAVQGLMHAVLGADS